MRPTDGALPGIGSFRLRCAAVPSDKRARQQANKHRMDELRKSQVQRKRRQRFFLVGGVAAVVIA